MDKPVWEMEGMSREDYVRLPMKEKIRILKKNGFKRTISKKPMAPPFSGSYLLDAYFKHLAEDFTIKYNYPNSNLSCGH